MLEKLLAEFGTLEATMAIEDSEQTDALLKVWVLNMGIFL